MYKIVKKLVNNNNIQILSVIIGEKPYYATKFDNGKSFNENLKIKQELERRFIKAGFSGIITMHDDASNGIYDKQITNNLNKFLK